jgi:hypothetical protein
MPRLTRSVPPAGVTIVSLSPALKLWAVDETLTVPKVLIVNVPNEIPLALRSKLQFELGGVAT